MKTVWEKRGLKSPDQAFSQFYNRPGALPADLAERA
jgi:hypothetical protein